MRGGVLVLFLVLALLPLVAGQSYVSGEDIETVSCSNSGNGFESDVAFVSVANSESEVFHCVKKTEFSEGTQFLTDSYLVVDGACGDRDGDGLQDLAVAFNAYKDLESYGLGGPPYSLVNLCVTSAQGGSTEQFVVDSTFSFSGCSSGEIATGSFVAGDGKVWTHCVSKVGENEQEGEAASCVDSDDTPAISISAEHSSLFTVGSVELFDAEGKLIGRTEDECSAGNDAVIEAYCNEGGGLGTHRVECANSCFNGRCVTGDERCSGLGTDCGDEDDEDSEEMQDGDSSSGEDVIDDGQTSVNNRVSVSKKVGEAIIAFGNQEVCTLWIFCEQRNPGLETNIEAGRQSDGSFLFQPEYFEEVLIWLSDNDESLMRVLLNDGLVEGATLSPSRTAAVVEYLEGETCSFLIFCEQRNPGMGSNLENKPFDDDRGGYVLDKAFQVELIVYLLPRNPGMASNVLGEMLDDVVQGRGSENTPTFQREVDYTLVVIDDLSRDAVENAFVEIIHDEVNRNIVSGALTDELGMYGPFSIEGEATLSIIVRKEGYVDYEDSEIVGVNEIANNEIIIELKPAAN